jgi:hypothetical protein
MASFGILSTSSVNLINVRATLYQKSSAALALGNAYQFYDLLPDALYSRNGDRILYLFDAAIAFLTFAVIKAIVSLLLS